MRRWTLLPLPMLALLGCPAGTPEPDPPEEAECEYPEGVVEPMTLDEVSPRFAWDTALHLDGREASLDLGDAYCGTDDVITWSDRDVVLFVSIPPW